MRWEPRYLLKSCVATGHGNVGRYAKEVYLYNIQQEHGGGMKSIFICQFIGDNWKFGYGNRKRTYLCLLCMKYCYKTATTNKATVRNYDVICDRYNGDKISNSKRMPFIIPAAERAC